MIVVDTCIITHLFNLTEYTSLAQQLLKVDADWRIPSTWREEYANVLAKLSKKSKCTAQEVVHRFMTTCEQLQNREYKIHTKDALECALEYKISVYDAHFVVLAEQLDTRLLTEDGEVLKKCPKRACSMGDFLSKVMH